LTSPIVRKTAALVVSTAFAFGLGGCGILIQCAPPPTSEGGFCAPGQPACDEGSPDPMPDTRQDGAVDITQFAPGQIPTRVVLSVPNEGRLHVAPDITPTYQFNPPASGPHVDASAPTGVYCEPLSPRHWVHSLEHGYIVVLYDPAHRLPLGDVLAPLLWLAPPSRQFGNVKLVIAPYAGLPHPVCAVAWNRQLYLDCADYARLLLFYVTYIDLGPEQEA